MPSMNFINKAASWIGRGLSRGGRSLMKGGDNMATTGAGQILRGAGMGLRQTVGRASWGQIGAYGGSSLAGGIIGAGVAGPDSRMEGFIGGAMLGGATMHYGRGLNRLRGKQLTNAGLLARTPKRLVKNPMGVTGAFGATKGGFGVLRDTAGNKIMGRGAGITAAAGLGLGTIGLMTNSRGDHTQNIAINPMAVMMAPQRNMAGRYATLRSNNGY